MRMRGLGQLSAIRSSPGGAHRCIIAPYSRSRLIPPCRNKVSVTLRNLRNIASVGDRFVAIRLGCTAEAVIEIAARSHFSHRHYTSVNPTPGSRGLNAAVRSAVCWTPTPSRRVRRSVAGTSADQRDVIYGRPAADIHPATNLFGRSPTTTRSPHLAAF